MTKCPVFFLVLGFSVFLASLCVRNVTGCDTGWSSFGDYCYTIVVSESEYYQDATEARRECRKRGADVAIIRTEEEQAFLADQLANSSAKEVYLGFSDARNEGQFLAFDGTETAYTNWAKNEPNNYAPFGGEDCVSMKKDSYWNDVPCTFNPREIDGVFCKTTATRSTPDISPRFFHDVFYMIKASYMMNNTISAINVPTYVDCMRLCSGDFRCLSVNYNRYGITDYNCILNGHSTFMSRNLTSDSSVAGFDVQEWIYYEQTYKGP